MPRKSVRPPLHVSLREWREAAGLRLDDASVYASQRLPARVSRETIRRYESGAIAPDKMDVLTLVALIGVYNRRLRDLPDDVTRHVEKAVDLLTSTPGCSTEDKKAILVA